MTVVQRGIEAPHFRYAPRTMPREWAVEPFEQHSRGGDRRQKPTAPRPRQIAVCGSRGFGIGRGDLSSTEAAGSATPARSMRVGIGHVRVVTLGKHLVRRRCKESMG